MQNMQKTMHKLKNKVCVLRLGEWIEQNNRFKEELNRSDDEKQSHYDHLYHHGRYRVHIKPLHPLNN